MHRLCFLSSVVCDLFFDIGARFNCGHLNLSGSLALELVGWSKCRDVMVLGEDREGIQKVVRPEAHGTLLQPSKL